MQEMASPRSSGRDYDNFDGDKDKPCRICKDFKTFAKIRSMHFASKAEEKV